MKLLNYELTHRTSGCCKELDHLPEAPVAGDTVAHNRHWTRQSNRCQCGGHSNHSHPSSDSILGGTRGEALENKTKQNKKMKKNFLQVCFHLFLFSGVWDESKISLVAMSADDERTLMIILEKITAVSDCFKVVQCMKSAVVCKWAALNLHSAFLWKHHAF